MPLNNMEKQKKYKYKIWLEVERVEIDAKGNEIGKHERGEIFGYEPEEMYCTSEEKEMQGRFVELSNPNPHVALLIEGGNLQSIYTDGAVSVSCMDTDAMEALEWKDDRTYRPCLVTRMTKENLTNMILREEAAALTRYPDSLYSEE